MESGRDSKVVRELILHGFVLLLVLTAVNYVIHSSKRWVYLGYAILVSVLVVATVLLQSLFVEWKRRRWLRCPHGIRGGNSGNCRSCGAERQRAEEEKQRQRAADLAAIAERQRRREMERSAANLRASELERLRKNWLSQTDSYLQMQPRQFENAIAQLFRELGYKVTQTPYSNDHGKDAIAWKDGKKYLIECKRYAPEGRTIGRRDLQVFFAAMQEESAEAGFYVNTGAFASTAIEYAAKSRIVLCDRQKLLQLVVTAYAVPGDVSKASVMCSECGIIQVMDVTDTPTTGTCQNGHEITNSITTELIASAELPALGEV